METLQVSFRGFEPSKGVETTIQDRAKHLERFHDRITSCRIMVELPHRHHETGNLYHVRIDLTVPGHEIVVTRDQQDNPKHADVYLAVSDAFDRAERRLQDLGQRQRGEVKNHQQGHATGRVARLFPDEGYGFIETTDLRDVYFHQNAVLDGAYARLTVGDSVRFVEEMGAKGPQASTVAVVTKV